MPPDETLRSRENPLYKRLRALKERGGDRELCLLEGPKLVLEALAAEHPTMASIERFGLALFESIEKRREQGKSSTRKHRERVVGEPEGPIDDARLRAFEVVREEIEGAGGVLPFEACSGVTRSASNADAPATFTASFRTRGGGVYRATLVEEHDVVRLAAVGRQ